MNTHATDLEDHAEPLPETAGVSPALEADEPPPYDGSLTDDVTALIKDGKTYLSAEVQYQKTRARYVGKHASRAAAFAMAGMFCVFFALMGLTVGGVLLLIPRIGPIASTALVVVVWLLFGAICAFYAGGNAARVNRAIKEKAS